MKLKYAGTICATLLLLAGAGARADTKADGWEGWHQDWKETMGAAKSNGVPIFALFTGSSWCGPCQQLETDVFSTAEFKKWAKGRVELFVVVFPPWENRPEEYKALADLQARIAGDNGVPNWAFCTSDGTSFAKGCGYGCGDNNKKWYKQANRDLAKLKRK